MLFLTQNEIPRWYREVFTLILVNFDFYLVKKRRLECVSSFFQLKRLFSPKKYGWVWTNRNFFWEFLFTFFFNCLTIRFCLNVLKILEFVQVQPRWLLQFTTFSCFANPVWKPVFKNQKKDTILWLDIFFVSFPGLKNVFSNSFYFIKKKWGLRIYLFFWEKYQSWSKLSLKFFNSLRLHQKV